MSEKKPGARPVEPDPDERDEHAYEDTWYRALKGSTSAATKTRDARRGDAPARTARPRRRTLEEPARGRTALPLVLGPPSPTRTAPAGVLSRKNEIARSSSADRS